MREVTTHRGMGQNSMEALGRSESRLVQARKARHRVAAALWRKARRSRLLPLGHSRQNPLKTIKDECHSLIQIAHGVKGINQVRRGSPID